MSKGRPGGNPEISKYGFKTERINPLTAKITLRVSEKMRNKLNNIQGWQERVRELIAEEYEIEDN